MLAASAAAEPDAAELDAAELEARLAVEDIDTLEANSWANSAVISAAAAATASAPLVAVAGMSASFPAEKAGAVAALVPFTGPTPAIASS